MFHKLFIYLTLLRNYFKNRFHFLVTAFLKMILNEHMRRVIFIASLHAQIKDIRQPDKDVLEKLGNVMSLSLKYKEAPELAMYVSGRIWKKPVSISCHTGICFHIEDLKDIGMINLNAEQMRIIADQILKVIPDWLRYGSNRMMKKDVMKLLGNLQAI